MTSAAPRPRTDVYRAENSASSSPKKNCFRRSATQFTTAGMWKFSHAGVVFRRFCGWFQR